MRAKRDLSAAQNKKKPRSFIVQLQENLLETLRSKFKHSDFRPGQKEVIENLLQGRSVVSLMPTGFGKSLTYFFTAAMLPGMTLVVSPLIALIQDQVKNAKNYGLKVAGIHSLLSSEERSRALESVVRGEIKILFVTPERFRKKEFLEVLLSLPISLFVVDEAHCISQWGFDFRPDYGLLGKQRALLGNPLTLATSATVTLDAQKEIIKSLDIPTAKILHAGIKRENLMVKIFDLYSREEKFKAAESYLFDWKVNGQGSAVIYFSQIQELYKWAEYLDKNKFSFNVYHGDLNSGERKKQQVQFFQQDHALMLATPAFGLGVDKPNIRLVMHVEIPASIESYFQEIGRAGRDGLRSQSVLFYDQEDVSLQMEYIKWAVPDAEFVMTVYEKIKKGGEALQQKSILEFKEQLTFKNKRDFRLETALNWLWKLECLKTNRNRLGYEVNLELDAEMADLLKTSFQNERIKKLNQSLLKMVHLAEMTDGCRMQNIYQHFNVVADPCGLCDLCQLKSAV